MTTVPEFRAWPKTPRLFRNAIVTEKIDGTNAAVIVTDDGYVYAQSRRRLLSPGKATDNYGFAAWVEQHADELRHLGPGYHYGEWYGVGINRGYGLDERRFALFNANRRHGPLPDCVEVVPVIHEGAFDTTTIRSLVDDMRAHGSLAVPGFMRPEGLIVYHTASRQSYKVLLENDERAKGSSS